MDMFFSFSIFATGDANSIVAFVRLPNSEIANFKMQGVNGLDGLYFDVTCRFILHWVFGDTLSLWLAVLRHFNIITYGTTINRLTRHRKILKRG